MRRVISVWLPFFPTDRLRRLRDPALAPDAACATIRSGGRGRVVVAADQKARALGVRPGMVLTEAEIRAPGLVTAAADPMAENRTLHGIASWCLRYAPLAAPDPPDGLWIESFGSAHLFGGERTMLADIRKRFTVTGFTVRLAIADTPGAARALAHYGKSAQLIAPPGRTEEALAGLPLRALRIEEEAAMILERLGITRVSMLAEMPRGALARRFGEAVLRRLDQALGRAPEPITPPPSIDTPVTRLAFIEPLLTAEALSFAITRLAGGLCRRLERRGAGARRLDLLFERIDGTTTAIHASMVRPRRDARYLTRLLGERLTEIDPEPGIAIMRLQASLIEPLAPLQTAAHFAGEDGAPDLAALIDWLSNRLGERRLYRASPVESDVPERSVARLPPLAAPSGKTWPVALPRPARLLSSPEPVQVTALLPDHPPAQFLWRGHRYRLVAGDGPERVFGEWWKNDAETFAIRDYFRVEDTSGHRYWLFRHGDGSDPTTGDGGWFLHGFF